MADDDREDSTPRRPTPNPASRARRIGGRVAPRPAPRADTDDSAQPSTGVVTDDPGTDRADGAGADTAAAPAVALDKPSRRVAGRPGRGAADADAGPDGDTDADADGRAATAKRTTTPAPSRRVLPVRWLPAGVLGVAAIVLAVFVVIASHGVYWAKPDDSAGARLARQEAVLASAKKCFGTLFSYDYRQLSGVLARDLACTTGKFSTDLKKTVQTQILPVAPKLKATQTAQVNSAGIVSVSPDGNQVVALLFGQLSQSNTATAKSGPRIDLLGAVMTMTKVKGSWLVSKVAYDDGTSSGS